MKIYICGDSFAYPDPEYGPNWVDLLQQQISHSIINLSCVGASNLAIGIQVQRAIAEYADYIIYLATSSVRNDVALRYSNKMLTERYTDIVANDKSKDIISYSTSTLHNAGKFLSANQLDLLTKYHHEFFDLDLAIQQNQFIIEGILSLLKSSDIPFIFDRGGFEHKKYSNRKEQEYFLSYSDHFSAINLWDYVAFPPAYRPYYHITDAKIHQLVADYYTELLK